MTVKNHSVRISGKEEMEVAIDLSGLDEISRWNLEKALKKERVLR